MKQELAKLIRQSLHKVITTIELNYGKQLVNIKAKVSNEEDIMRHVLT